MMARRAATGRAVDAEPDPQEGQDPAAAVDPAAEAVVVQGAPGVNQVAPVFALCPGQLNPDRPLDYSKAGDVKLYGAAMEPFIRDQLFDIESAR